MGVQAVDPQTTKVPQPGFPLRPLLRSCALLAAALVPAGIAAGWICSPQFNSRAMLAAATAVGICWLSGSLALAVTCFGTQFRLPVQGVLGGMLVRMALPLVAGIVLSEVGGPLAEANVFSMIVGVYLCALVVETLLSLRMIPAPGPSLKAAPVIDRG